MAVWLTSPLLVVVGTLLALAGGSQTRPLWDSLPFLVWIWVAGLNVLAWTPATLTRSERFYDLIGSTSFISSVGLVWWFVQPSVAGSILLLCVATWSARMAWFLVGRIRQQGKDGRFDTIKTDPFRFLNAWLMQAIWAYICLAPVVVLVSVSPYAGWSTWMVAGITVWMVGFAIEVISDEQKRRFRAARPDGNGFITSGLWSKSRHPNYVGEIVLWTGLTIPAIPVVSGWQMAALITPVFVYVLLRFVSGVPLLEKRSDEKWGGLPEYEAYKNRTPILFPKPF